MKKPNYSLPPDRGFLKTFVKHDNTMITEPSEQSNTEFEPLLPALLLQVDSVSQHHLRDMSLSPPQVLSPLKPVKSETHLRKDSMTDPLVIHCRSLIKESKNESNVAVDYVDSSAVLSMQSQEDDTSPGVLDRCDSLPNSNMPFDSFQRIFE